MWGGGVTADDLKGSRKRGEGGGGARKRGGDGWRVLNYHWPTTWRGEGEGGKRELLVFQFLILI